MFLFELSYLLKIILKDYKLTMLSVKVEIRNWGMKWGEWDKWNENVGNHRRYSGNLCGNAENAENQCGDAGNQCRNLSTAVEMT